MISEDLHLWPKRGEFEDTLNGEEQGEEEVEVAADEKLLIFFDGHSHKINVNMI